MVMQKMLPPGYESVRNSLVWRKYITMEKRAISYKIEFLIEEARARLGEQALDELRKIGVVDDPYAVVDCDTQKRELLLMKTSGLPSFGRGTIVRAIGIERNIPLLACINAIGSLVEIDSNKVRMRIYRDNIRRVAKQMRDLQILLSRTEIDLTARELEGLEYLHLCLGSDYGLYDPSRF